MGGIGGGSHRMGGIGGGGSQRRGGIEGQSTGAVLGQLCRLWLAV